MKVTIASYSFHGLTGDGMMDAFGYIESIKYHYRLDAADFWNGTMGPIDPDHLRKVKQALADREMALANYHVDGVHVWEDDPDARERNYRSALEHLKAAAYLGAQTVRIDMGGQGEALSDEQLDLIVRRYREYAEFGHAHGFKVGPETHWGPSLVPAVQETVYKGVDHPAYGILLHIGHWVEGQEEIGDRMAAPWAIHTHVDARIARTCLDEKIRLLLDAGYDGYWGVEHHSAKNEYVEVTWQLAEVQLALTKILAERGAERAAKAG
jgi:sugar phosphate isomerase/epimerase